MADMNTSMIEQCCSDGVMLDIGANHGSYTELMARKSKKVYAFEPAPENIKVLKERMKDIPNVEIHEVALSDKTEKTKLMLHGNPGACSIHAILDGQQWHHTLENSVDVDAITLDLWCQYNGITRVDGIKIDVEAHEKEVIDGARETLKKYHPLIALETHHTADLQGLGEILKECGYDTPEIEINKAYLLK
jgi:FkbM family methyltransferase